MTLSHRFWIFALTAAGIILMIVTGMALYIWFHLTFGQTQAVMTLIRDHLAALLTGVLLLSLVFWALSDLVYANYIKPVRKISTDVALIYASNPSLRIPIAGNQDIQALARTINTFADTFERLNQDIATQVVAARKETEQERNLLAAIMGELPQGLIICNQNGRILLYNTLAKNIFTCTMVRENSEQFMGLGRSIFHLVDKDLISHAMEEIHEQLTLGENSAGSFFITPLGDHSLISVEAIPVLDKTNQITGFILAILNITRDVEKFQSMQRGLADFRRFLEKKSVAEQNFFRLSDTIQNTYLSRLPLSQLNLARFLFKVQKLTGQTHDIRINVHNLPRDDRIMADTYSFTKAIVFLFRTLSDWTYAIEFDLTVTNASGRIQFNITWEGVPVDKPGLDTIIKTTIRALPGFKSILALNNARLNVPESGETHFSHIILSVKKSTEPPATSHRTPVLAGSRPEFYDFDLFKVTDSDQNLLKTRLTDLSYTVFDTETTGLNPEGGDEIISMGAVRIVNNRLLSDEVFEELVNPGRDIPVASYRIHGIHHEMVAEKDPIELVLPRFRQFVADTVLVGHNIAFDMKLIKLKEKITRIKFANPVLDTLLLSAFLHPIHEQHDMENIAQRLGISMISRHTAFGDALTTAQIFLKLIPILNSNGILTLEDAIHTSKNSYYARLKY
ncbi:3'-5' exonuclease [Desulfotignum phosphitoxidans]|uniref:DNA polymerase III, subunit epsilon DnaQ n=1 Tax=Desulfotignum phosphitoxidans DSM 13687 TaxID=1286635 RepID=S0G6H9_9BACT|nr:exonuclease domain-containing protein [Desulfotignum phosphitoxidans]EMS80076.1 DNA polymerase III, subunit epsilon DnaQ [Desulfotignum phosphitoxidans DSM 13687]